jgi:nucleotide-binding universal stress UspA family protein
MIVVGIDGSEGAARALRFAAQEASLRDTDLRIVAVWNVPAAYYASEAMAPNIPVEQFEQSMRAAAERQVDECLDEYPDVKRHLIVTEGTPSQVLVEKSERADMLVVGSRGLGGFRGLMLGSVGQQCAHHANCPVVIVPHE